MSNDTALTIAGIGIALAVPATFMFANYIRKNVEHGEAQFRAKPDDSDDEGDN
ncbi:glutamyl-tRNA amidotransferase [Erythrobacter sp. HA6-11]